MSKIKIFANFVKDYDSIEYISNIGLNPDVFSKCEFEKEDVVETGVYFQEIDPNTEMTRYGGWKPWNGYVTNYGFLDNNDKYYDEDDEIFDTLNTIEYEEFMSHLVPVDKIEVFKEGVLVETKYNKI